MANAKSAHPPNTPKATPDAPSTYNRSEPSKATNADTATNTLKPLNTSSSIAPQNNNTYNTTATNMPN